MRSYYLSRCLCYHCIMSQAKWSQAFKWRREWIMGESEAQQGKQQGLRNSPLISLRWGNSMFMHSVVYSLNGAHFLATTHLSRPLASMSSGCMQEPLHKYCDTFYRVLDVGLTPARKIHFDVRRRYTRRAQSHCPCVLCDRQG